MLNLILSLVVLGVALYLVELIPMDGTVRQIIRVLAILLVLIYVLQAVFGLTLPVRLR